MRDEQYSIYIIVNMYYNKTADFRVNNCTCHSKYANEKPNVSAREHHFFFRISSVFFLSGPKTYREYKTIEENNGYHAHDVHFLQKKTKNNT